MRSNVSRRVKFVTGFLLFPAAVVTLAVTLEFSVVYAVEYPSCLFVREFRVWNMRVHCRKRASALTEYIRRNRVAIDALPQRTLPVSVRTCSIRGVERGCGGVGSDLMKFDLYLRQCPMGKAEFHALLALADGRRDAEFVKKICVLRQDLHDGGERKTAGAGDLRMPAETAPRAGLTGVHRQAVALAEELFAEIMRTTPAAPEREDRFFGAPDGNVLGESLYASLGGSAAPGAGRGVFSRSPLIELLREKIAPLLRGKKRFSFAYADGIWTFEPGRAAPVTGWNASRVLTVRAIPDDGGKKFFENLADGVMFSFAVCFSDDRKTDVYFDLVNSYVGNRAFYAVLGFQGNYASGLRLAPSELERLKRRLRPESEAGGGKGGGE